MAPSTPRDIELIVRDTLRELGEGDVQGVCDQVAARLALPGERRHASTNRWFLPAMASLGAAGLAASLVALWLVRAPKEPEVSNLADALERHPNTERDDHRSHAVEGDPRPATYRVLGETKLVRDAPDRVELEFVSGRLEAATQPGRPHVIVHAGEHRLVLEDGSCVLEHSPPDPRVRVTVLVGRVAAYEASTDRFVQSIVPGEVVLLTTRSVVELPSAPAKPPETRRSSEEVAKWRTLAKGGDYEAALREIESQGFERVLARLRPADALTLADAARLARRFDRARQALLHLRTHHPRTAEGRIALFHLGRLAMEAGDRAASEAAFREYLSLGATPLAEEARGRLLELLSDAGRTTEASAAARAYLAHHPSGPHAKLARRLAATDPP